MLEVVLIDFIILVFWLVFSCLLIFGSLMNIMLLRVFWVWLEMFMVILLLVFRCVYLWLVV